MKSKFLVKSVKRASNLLFLLLICVLPVFSQLKEGETIDRIVAIVGNEMIMQSDVTGQLMMFAQQDPSINPNDTALRNRVLNSMINEKLFVAKAFEDSVTASEEEINQLWEYQVNRLVQAYGSEKRIEDVYGMSLARIKFNYHDDLRNQVLVQKVRDQKLQDVKVSPREVEEFYTKYKDSLPVIPAQVELCHLVKNVEANRRAKEELLDLAKKIRDSLTKGGDFSLFAARYSKDPGTASDGGNLGWFEKGKLLPEYDKAAFSLQPGQISAPIETPFGYHLIMLVDKNKDSVLTKHILFKFGEATNELDSVKSFLIDIKAKVEKGASFEDLAKQLSDEKETQGFGGSLGKFPLGSIPGAMKDIIDKLQDGQVSDPYPYSSEPKVSFHIIYRKKTYQEHKPTLENDFKDIEVFSINAKKSKLLAEWVESLRKHLYWEIKN